MQVKDRTMWTQVLKLYPASVISTACSWADAVETNAPSWGGSVDDLIASCAPSAVQKGDVTHLRMVCGVLERVWEWWPRYADTFQRIDSVLRLFYHQGQ